MPREVWWDNPKTVATQILTGRQRKLHDRYAAFASHYNFDPLFRMPARGNEKPHAENRVKNLHSKNWGFPTHHAKRPRRETWPLAPTITCPPHLFPRYDRPHHEAGDRFVRAVRIPSFVGLKGEDPCAVDVSAHDGLSLDHVAVLSPPIRTKLASAIDAIEDLYAAVRGAVDARK